MKSEGSGVDRGCGSSVFLSTVILVLPDVFALTRRSLEVGRGLVAGVAGKKKKFLMAASSCSGVEGLGKQI